MNECEISFCQLRRKEIINSCDGKKLGRIIDLVFSSSTGQVSGFVAPYKRESFFAKPQSLFIPLSCIQKIGEDVILISVVTDAEGNLTCSKPPTKAAAQSCESCDGECASCKLYQ